MAPEAWLQMFLTICAMIVAMVVFYFNNEKVLRKEILASEHRLQGSFKELTDNVAKIDTRVAVLEDRDDREPTGRLRLPSTPGRY